MWVPGNIGIRGNEAADRAAKETLNTEPTAGLVTVQELCESRGGHPGLSVLTSLQVSMDVICQLTSEDIKQHFIIIIIIVSKNKSLQKLILGK